MRCARCVLVRSADGANRNQFGSRVFVGSPRFRSRSKFISLGSSGLSSSSFTRPGRAVPFDGATGITFLCREQNGRERVKHRRPTTSIVTTWNITATRTSGCDQKARCKRSRCDGTMRSVALAPRWSCARCRFSAKDQTMGCLYEAERADRRVGTCQTPLPCHRAKEHLDRVSVRTGFPVSPPDRDGRRGNAARARRAPE